MKTEIKHTPGPWIVDDRHIHPANGLTYPAGQEPETDIIALVDTDHHTNGLLNDTDKANLCLIASAPTMLDELTRLRADKAELLEALQTITEWTYNQSAPLETIREQARTLLAKHRRSTETNFTNDVTGYGFPPTLILQIKP